MKASSVVRQNHVLESLPPYVFAELDRLKAAARAEGRSLVDLGIGSPDTAPGAPITAALAAAVSSDNAFGYPPFRGVPAYFDAIGRFMQSRFGVDIDTVTEVLALSGAKEGLAQLLMAICESGDTVLVPEIYYPVYARASWLSGADVSWMPMRAENNFLIDFDAISAADASRARALIVNYPNNPTGAVADLAFYERAVAFARRHEILLISDLAYSELTFSGDPAPSALEVAGAKDVCIEFHSFSKTFSMAGYRLGFCVGNSDAIEALAAYRTNVGYGTPTSLQHAGAFALDQRAELVPSKVASYQERRDAIIGAFNTAGWHPNAPEASMYLWLQVPAGVDDWDWVKTLIFEDGIVVTPGVAFGQGGAGYFRISLVRDKATLAQAATTIAQRRTLMTR